MLIGKSARTLSRLIWLAPGPIGAYSLSRATSLKEFMDVRNVDEQEMTAAYTSPEWVPSERMLRHFQDNDNLIIDDGNSFYMLIL